ncbi:MAG: endonuclease/exonuclease/phosphatase family protein, partial [Candidatus Thiodiazotropha sp.]
MSFISWNIEGLKYKLYDHDFINFLKSFDIFGLLETWVCDVTEIRDSFSDYFCMFCPAKKEKKFGRAMGGIAVYLKTYLKNYVTRLVSDCTFGVFMKIDRMIFGTDKDVILSFIYIPPVGSPFYKTEEFSNIELLEHQFMSLPINLSEFYFILCGDFNARTGIKQDFVKIDTNIPAFHEYHEIFDMGEISERSSCDKTVSPCGNDLLNFCKVYSLIIVNGRCGRDLNGSYTYISTQGCSLIDYVLCSPDLLTFILDFNIEIRTESKHLPVSTSLKNVFLDTARKLKSCVKNGNGSQNITKYNFSAQNVDIFKQNIGTFFTNERIHDFIIRIDDSSISADNIAKMFVSCLCDSSVQYTVKTKYKSNAPWFDEDCVRSKKQKYSILRRFRNTNSDVDRDEYIRARNSFKQLCAEKKSMYQTSKLDDLISSVNDQKAFWSKLKAMTRRSSRKGNISNDDWLRHFESLFNEGADNEDDENNEDFYADFNLDDVQEQIFNADITDEEIIKAVKSLKMGKSAGLDGVLPEMFFHSLHLILPLLTRFFNRLFKTGDFPESWGKSIIVPLHKKGSLDLPDNYRGIALLSVFSKLYTSVLTRRVTFYVNMYD